MILFYAILARKHGAASGYPVIAAFDADGHAAVHARYEELTGSTPAGETFRAENAEMQLVVELAVVAHHHFPDPAEIQRQKDAKLLAEALQARAARDLAQAKLENAKAEVALTKRAVVTLSPEQQRLVEAHDTRLADAALVAELTDDSAERAAASRAEQARLAAEAAARSELSTELAGEHTAALTDAVVVVPPTPMPASTLPPEGEDEPQGPTL